MTDADRTTGDGRPVPRRRPSKGERRALVEARAPWMADEARYPVAVALEGDGTPRIEELRRRDFPDWLVANKFNKWFLNREYLSSGWRCTITGVQCHAAPKRFYDGNHRGMPWALTIDHLVPTRMRADNELTDRLVNQATVGWYVNYKLGHVPLAVKLMHRSAFRASRFGERPPTRETCAEVRAAVIRNEDALRVDGLYPWQPSTYPPGPGRDAAVAFMARMAEFDADFLRIEPLRRTDFMDSFAWVW